MNYEILVFDWDGTLYDSSSFICQCVMRAAADIGLPPPEEEAVRSAIGLSLDKAIDRGIPNLSPMKKANLVKAYREHVSRDTNRPKLFEGAVETLHSLASRGYLLAVATGKDSRGLFADLEALNLKDLFTITRCADQSASKPNPEMLEYILDQTGMMPRQALMIGDTSFDMQMAENAGVDALAVSYGVHGQDQLKGEAVKGIIHHIRELPDWLDRPKG